MYEPTKERNPLDFTSCEYVLFRRIFYEVLDQQIPALLFDIWNPEDFVVHKLPETHVEKLELYGVPGDITSCTLIPINEYADYKNLPDTENPTKVIEIVESLAEGAAKSYAWNVRNAYLKGGRLRFGRRLHVSDWVDEFKVNIMKNAEGGCPDDESVHGWVAYHYRFVAAKI